MANIDNPKAMSAWRFDSTSGGLEKTMRLDKNVPIPTAFCSLKKDQVLVKVAASAINPVDYKLAELPLISGFILKRPTTPGLDYAGTVINVGSDSLFRPGQRVFGRLSNPTRHGTVAEYTISDKTGTIELPDGISFDDAASIGTAALTAYSAIRPHVKKGDYVFINGGSGGTGVYSIQIAKAIGCFVSTTCSTPNVPLCKELGADQVIDYKKSDVVEELIKTGNKYDLVVDNIGSMPAIYWQSWKYAKPKAMFVQVGVEPSLFLDVFKRLVSPGFLGGPGLRYSIMMVKNDPDKFRQLSRWMEEGKVKAVKESVFAYEDANKAFEKLKTGRTRGKIVVAGPTA